MNYLFPYLIIALTVVAVGPQAVDHISDLALGIAADTAATMGAIR